MNQLWPALSPEWRPFPESERRDALATAREAVLDVTELVAMAVFGTFHLWRLCRPLQQRGHR